MTASASFEFWALGTGAVVVTADRNAIDAAVAAARVEIDAIDRACSRFRTDSDLERVNNAGGRTVPVGPVLLDAVGVALEAARWTAGDVDPTIGSALRLLGYDRDFAEVGSARTERHPMVMRFAEVAGWQVVELDRLRGTVRVPAGVRLDLGATAKALAADRAAAAAHRVAGCGVLVGLGGDVACAGPVPAAGWPVFVTEWHGANLDADGQVITLHGGGLATSSTTVRRWRHGDAEVHHIVDPRTGGSADVYWRTVTVCAASCVQANIATTAAIVRGAPADAWLTSLNVPARLVRHDGTVLHVGRWPEDLAA